MEEMTKKKQEEKHLAEQMKSIESLKARISILNEVYVQTSMEYYALANLVGVQLDSHPDTEHVSSHHSSGFMSQRAVGN